MKAAIKVLNKTLEEQYTPAEIDTLQWFVDDETPEFYRWRFTFPEDGKMRTFTYVKSTKKVVIRRID